MTTYINNKPLHGIINSQKLIEWWSLYQENQILMNEFVQSYAYLILSTGETMYVCL